MTRWWRDTLFTRLFLLILLALVVSHLVAWGVVTRLFMPASPAAGRPAPPPGASAAGPAPAAAHAGFAAAHARAAGPLVAQAGGGLPLQVLVLDYAIRIALIALFAWWGARWLVLPVRRMVAAARTLGDGVSRGQPPAPLDDSRGTAEVREASAVFNQMAQRLAQEFRGRGLLMASISHDLRTPLTRMRIRLENLLPARWRSAASRTSAR
jgi:signal transduction histidine kinase